MLTRLVSSSLTCGANQQVTDADRANTIAEENLALSENIEHLKRIFELPIEVAEQLTDDELLEDVTEGRDE